MTEAKRGPGRPAKLAPSPADAPVAHEVASVVTGDPETQNAPAPASDVADVQAMMTAERAKIEAALRREFEAKQADARVEAKMEAERLVKAAAQAEAEQRAHEAEQLRLARATRDMVEVRVLPKGDGQVYTGDVDEITNAATTYRRGDKFWVFRSIAQDQEDAGRVEIL